MDTNEETSSSFVIHILVNGIGQQITPFHQSELDSFKRYMKTMNDKGTIVDPGGITIDGSGNIVVLTYVDKVVYGLDGEIPSIKLAEESIVNDGQLRTYICDGKYKPFGEKDHLEMKL